MFVGTCMTLYFCQITLGVPSFRGSCAHRRFRLQTCEDMVAGGVGITTLNYYRKEVDEFVLCAVLVFELRGAVISILFFTFVTFQV